MSRFNTLLFLLSTPVVLGMQSGPGPGRRGPKCPDIIYGVKQCGSPHYYQVIKDEQNGFNWHEAHTECKVNGGELASFSCHKDAINVAKWVIHRNYKNHEFEDGLWIGGIEKKACIGYNIWRPKYKGQQFFFTRQTWFWSDGNDFVSYANCFAPGEPNNHPPPQNCLQLRGDGFWDDAGCETRRKHILCIFTGFPRTGPAHVKYILKLLENPDKKPLAQFLARLSDNGGCRRRMSGPPPRPGYLVDDDGDDAGALQLPRYFYHDTKKTWAEAQSACEVEGKKLFVLDDSDELTEIKTQFADEDPYWIGANGDSTCIQVSVPSEFTLASPGCEVESSYVCELADDSPTTTEAATTTTTTATTTPLTTTTEMTTTTEAETTTPVTTTAATTTTTTTTTKAVETTTSTLATTVPTTTTSTTVPPTTTSE